MCAARSLARQARRGGGKFVPRLGRPAERDPVAVPRVEDPAYRAVTFDQVKAAYAEQIESLAEGGVDLLLIRERSLTR